MRLWLLLQHWRFAAAFFAVLVAVFFLACAILFLFMLINNLYFHYITLMLNWQEFFYQI